MRLIKRSIKFIVRKLFPNFYLSLKAKRFDTSTVIYKKETYQSFLEEAFKDFRPELSSTEKEPAFREDIPCNEKDKLISKLELSEAEIPI